MRWSVWPAVLVAAAVVMSPPVAAQRQESAAEAAVPMPLWRALQLLAQRHSVPIVLGDGVGTQVDVPVELPNASSLDAALDSMLAGRPLRWHRESGGGVVVERSRTATVALDTLAIDAVQHAGAQFSADAASALVDEPSRERWSGDRLAAIGALSVDALLRRTPNISGSGDALAIRGIERGSGGAATSQVYLDGIPLGGSYLRRGLLPVWLSHVDFLRGPRTARDALGGLAGAIDIVSAEPLPVPRQQIEAGVGTYGLRHGAMRIEGPMRPAGLSGSLQVAQRLSDDPVQSAAGHPGSNSDARLASTRLLYEPDAIESLSIDLSALVARGAPAGQGVLPPRDATEFDPFRYVSHDPFPPTHVLQADGANAVLRWQAGARDGFRLRLSSADTYAATTRATTAIGERSVIADREATDAVSLGWQHDFSARWSSDLTLEHVVRDSRNESRLVSPLAAFFPASAGVQVAPDTRRSLVTSARDHARERSAVLALAWADGDWSSRFAARVSDVDRRNARDVSSRLDMPGCVLRIGEREQSCSDEFPDFASRTSTPSRQREWAPQFELHWAPTPAWQAGLQLRRGLLPGGARLNPADGSLASYRAERSDTIELDASGLLADDRLQWHLGLFANRWRDRHVRVDLPAQSSFLIDNAGQARASGGELQLRLAADPQTTLWLGIGSLRTRFDRFELAEPGGSTDLAGNEFPGAPRWTATLGAQYRGERWRIAATAWASAAAFSDARNTAAGRRPAHQLLDLRLARELGGGGEVWLSASNLFDEPHLDDVRVAGTPPMAREYLPGERRQLAAGVGWNW